jgi:hypothetical protein
MQHGSAPVSGPRPWRRIVQALGAENNPKRIVELMAELSVAIDEQIATGQQPSALPLSMLMRKSEEVIRNSQELIAESKVLVREYRDAINRSRLRAPRP